MFNHFKTGDNIELFPSELLTSIRSDLHDLEANPWVSLSCLLNARF
jgi:hypothetical protein